MPAETTSSDRGLSVWTLARPVDRSDAGGQRAYAFGCVFQWGDPQPRGLGSMFLLPGLRCLTHAFDRSGRWKNTSTSKKPVSKLPVLPPCSATLAAQAHQVRLLQAGVGLLLASRKDRVARVSALGDLAHFHGLRAERNRGATAERRHPRAPTRREVGGDEASV